jgi:hypothetical protein
MDYKYELYLQSDEWAAIRNDLFAIRGKKCERCSNTKNLHVHHLHYKNIYQEEPADLEILCAKCHANEHKLNGKSNEPKIGVAIDTIPVFIQKFIHGADTNINYTEKISIAQCSLIVQEFTQIVAAYFGQWLITNYYTPCDELMPHEVLWEKGGETFHSAELYKIFFNDLMNRKAIVGSFSF